MDVRGAWGLRGLGISVWGGRGFGLSIRDLGLSAWCMGPRAQGVSSQVSTSSSLCENLIKAKQICSNRLIKAFHDF